MLKPKPKKDNQLQEKLDLLDEKYHRAIADYANLEKRTQSQRLQYLQTANRDLITKLLNILDDLQRAATHIDDDGLNMVIEGFQHLLASEGVTKIAVDNQPFDPETMECTDTVPGKKNQIIKVIQPGYTLNEYLLRPAQVTVGSGKKHK